MYGASSYKQYISNRTAEMKTTDEAFIADTTANQTKEEAVKAIIKQGWKSVVARDFDGAMTSFNQVWLLDQDNFNALWGYGAIFGSTDELQKSADYFDRAISMYSERKVVVLNDYLPLWNDAAVSFLNLSDVYAKSDPVKSKKYASKALDLLNNSLKQIDKLPRNMILQEMYLIAVAYFNLGDYQNARGAYDAAVKQFPEIKEDSSAVLLEKMLGEKGGVVNYKYEKENNLHSRLHNRTSGSCFWILYNFSTFYKYQS